MKIKIGLLFCAISVFLLGEGLLAQAATGVLSGKVLDSNTAEAVFGATVIVRAEKKVTKTDFDGKYSLELPPGSHLVEVQMFGYEPQKKSITIRSGSTTSLNVTFCAKT